MVQNWFSGLVAKPGNPRLPQAKDSPLPSKILDPFKIYKIERFTVFEEKNCRCKKFALFQNAD